VRIAKNKRKPPHKPSDHFFAAISISNQTQIATIMLSDNNDYWHNADLHRFLTIYECY
jgi:hypothetical protein